MEHHTKNKKLDEQLTKLVTIIAACALGVVIGSVAIWSHEKESGIAVDALIQKNGILKSSYDPREYRALRLENGIIALLISDKRSIVSAASVDVASGSMMDPWDYQGLAHFCEHMLFLGTDEYPIEDEFSGWLESRGGSTNAFTSLKNTNYYFYIEHERFPEALHRFSSFFVFPLLSKDAAAREVKAVSSEHAKNIFDDEWRIQQLLRSTSNPEHPYTKFGTGNVTTLDKPGVHDALLDYFTKYYVAERMKVVVISPETLDNLEKIVKNLFEKVPISRELKSALADQTKNTRHLLRVEDLNVQIDANSDQMSGQSQVPIRKIEQIGVRYDVVPVSEENSLRLWWFLPPVGKKEYSRKPLDYVSALLNTKQRGTPSFILQENGWIQDMSAGIEDDEDDFVSFTIQIDLTLEGLNKVNECLEIIFAYLGHIIKNGIKQEKWDELEYLATLDFDYLTHSDVSDWASSLSQDLRLIPVEDVIIYPFAYRDFDSEFISKVLGLLSPENSIHLVVSRQTASIANKNEYWYGTPYRESQIPIDIMQMWTRAFVSGESVSTVIDLPGPNPFIPSRNHFSSSSACVERSFEERSRNVFNSLPSLIRNDSFAEVWYKEDDVYCIPKLYALFKWVSPVTSSSPRESVLSMISLRLLEFFLKSELSQASDAGISTSFRVSKTGVHISVYGFADVQSIGLLVTKLLESFRSLLAINEIAQVTNAAQVIIDSIMRDEEDLAIYRARSYADHLLSPLVWSNDELLDILHSDITPQDISQHMQNIFGACKIQSLVHGAVNEDMSLHWVDEIIKSLNILPLQDDWSLSIVAKIPQGPASVAILPLPKFRDDNYALFSTFQLGFNSAKNNVLIRLFCSVIDPALYLQLRTTEQLGYIVSSYCSRKHEILSFNVMIESPNYPPVTIIERLRVFFDKFRPEIAGMSNDDLVDILLSQKSSLMAPYDSLFDESGDYSQEIEYNTLNFDRKMKSALYIQEFLDANENIVDALLDIWDVLLGSKRRELTTISVSSSGTKQEDLPDCPTVESSHEETGNVVRSDEVEWECRNIDESFRNLLKPQSQFVW